MNQISPSLVVVSDTHFVDAEESNARIFFQALERLDLEKLEYFVLLGDIFDFCFGASDYFKDKFRPFELALKKLVDNDVQVVFVQGNHEFSLEHISWDGIKIVSDFDHSIKTSDGTAFHFTHGDRLIAPKNYFLYLKITRSRIFSFFAKLLPQRKLDKLALSISRESRKKDEYRTLDHSLVLGKANQWLDGKEDGHGMFGHFHCPYFEDNKNNNFKILSLDCWYKPNFLTYGESGFARVFYDNSAEAAIEPCKSFLS